ncbi:alanine/glycine:cation symporter family protein [Pseudomonas aeruginosa]|uniref:alanine/glycine:cation symporter family protein n=1 Tax=Pseudomonas aeruginosa TaxID=287 RepID=UPI000FF34F6C|nr:alanine/glycine:cation symporter family protein [Pseudomonas aeruginosa]MBO3772624.1 alanine:cation symporter family protein [Pseudomonas aeruginosa]MCD2809450.1 alanine:cation symporter family protein [Pseudomonas aeruginosa]MCH0748704.1 alanine:cation symporter family protein [Pseudomonas aeruginosa]RWX92925.1 alanine:cation symporter family protein [Pseudomonas aeruginosa]HCF6142103.1 alanine:cation symporter family protein [Pseudomonas aeruginosa]
MQEFATQVVDLLNGLIWGKILIWLLVGCGLYFTVRLGLIQFRHFGHTFSVLKGSRQSDDSGISSFQALCTSLAARVGTGNVAGVAVAITLGGPGAVFWMWAIALVGMATGFVEATLAQLFKIRDDKGQFRGGPAYYMEKGLGARWMGILFSIFLIIAFGFVFNSVQANTITGAMQGAFGVPTWISGIAVVILTALIIFGGLRSIARFSELAVPFMAVAYLLLAVGIILFNLSELPGVLAMVVKSAFGWHEAAAGGIGAAILNGFKRGLFSNEAGMGSAPNAAASATPYPPHPASQGYVQMAGVFIDTLLICTASAAIILLAGPQEGEGIMLVQNALTSQVGDWGRYFLAVIILFFAFTSIVANYFYAENCLVFLKHNHLAGLLIFRLIVLAMVMFGALASLPFVWNLADVSMGLMAITNLIAILLLSNLAIKLAKDYNAQRKAGKLPTFDASQFPEVQQKLEPGIWDDRRA